MTKKAYTGKSYWPAVPEEDEDNAESPKENDNLSWDAAMFPGGFEIDDKVRVTKEGRMKGKTAIVLQPKWNGLVKVNMDEPDAKGTVKSYKSHELEKIHGDRKARAVSFAGSDDMTASSSEPVTCRHQLDRPASSSSQPDLYDTSDFLRSSGSSDKPREDTSWRHALKRTITGEVFKANGPNLHRRGSMMQHMLVQTLLSPAENTQELENEEDFAGSATMASMASPSMFGANMHRTNSWLASASSSSGTEGSFRRARKRLKTGWQHAYKTVCRISNSAASQLPDVCSDGIFRVLDRDGSFGQSIGTWAIHNVALKKKKGSKQIAARLRRRNSDITSLEIAEDIASLHVSDVYHAFLDTPFSKQIAFIVAAYVISLILFALMYLFISEPCNLGLEGSFSRAYLLSVEAMITIGYGVPDPYMNGCFSATVVLTAQSILQLLLSSFVIGVIFQRISSPQSRAATILFSEKAAIRELDGAHYLMFRLCDMRIQHALIEPHVRCYCLHKDPKRGYEFAPMRLQHPDDEQGGALLMTLPMTIVHRIDAWSPLAPPRISHEASSETSSGWQKEHLHTLRWPGTLQRQVDSESGNRDSCICPTCGETFGTAVMLQTHCRYNAKADIASGYPEDEAHREMGAAELPMMSHGDPGREEIENHLFSGHMEVVVLVEGIEPTTSSTLQARHSYLIGGEDEEALDVAWDVDFEDCCKSLGDTSKGLVVDLSRFHTLRSIHKPTDDDEDDDPVLRQGDEDDAQENLQFMKGGTLDPIDSSGTTWTTSDRSVGAQPTVENP